MSGGERLSVGRFEPLRPIVLFHGSGISTHEFFMASTYHGSSSPTIAPTEPGKRRVIAGLVDGTVETVDDLRLRGRSEEIAAELRENHLPALAEAGYIEWDRENGTIRPGPNFDEAAAHVADLPTPDGEPADD